MSAEEVLAIVGLLNTIAATVGAVVGTLAHRRAKGAEAASTRAETAAGEAKTSAEAGAASAAAGARSAKVEELTNTGIVFLLQYMDKRLMRLEADHEKGRHHE